MKTVRWLLENFGSLIIFQSVNYFFNFRAAIIASLVFAVVEMAIVKVQKRPVTPFMTFCLGLILVFGATDLYLGNSQFMKYESVIFNLIFAGFFGLSLFREKSIIEELAEQQGRIEKVTTPDKTFFFRLLTTVWFLYYVTKAFVYLWISANHSLGESFVLRTIISMGSFYILLGISLGLSRPLWKALLWLRLMPSTRSSGETAS